MKRITTRMKKADKLKELRARIEKGVKLLDKKVGRKKWLKKIDLSILDLADSDICICGQIFSSFWNAVSTDGELGFTQEQSMNDEDITYGFNLFASENNLFDTLTNLWYVKIVDLKIKANLIP